MKRNRGSIGFSFVAVRICLIVVLLYFAFIVLNLFLKQKNSQVASASEAKFHNLQYYDGPAEVNSYYFVKDIDNLSMDIDMYDQTNLTLISYIRAHHLTPPSQQLPYTFELEGPNGIIEVIWPILRIVGKVRGNGFFVEAGAYDGLEASNTVWLEKVHGWTGLLVECHPVALPLLKEKHRKAFIADVCLSKFSHPAKASLTSVDGWNPSSSLASEKRIFPKFAKNFTTFKVQTIPLYSLLASLSITEVDFISLDVQSLELDVLKNFPFHLVLVKVWLIEIDLLSEEDRVELKKLMLANHYAVPARLSGSDLLFLHESVKFKMFKEIRPFYCAYFTCKSSKN